MSQKPIDKRSLLATREYLWAVMLKLVSFNAVGLSQHTRYSASTVRSYLKGLAAAGYLQVTINTDIGPGTIYTIDPETAPHEPPRVREDGTAVTQGMGRHNMWRTMKMLKEFTLSQLMAFATTETCTIAVGEAGYYCEYLGKAGYISIVEGATPSTWRFNADRYTGPKAPMIQKVLNVYDQNTGKVVWQSGKGGTL